MDFSTPLPGFSQGRIFEIPDDDFFNSLPDHPRPRQGDEAPRLAEVTELHSEDSSAVPIQAPSNTFNIPCRSRETSVSRNRTSQNPTPEEWEAIRPAFTKHYIDRDESLKDVMTMIEKDGRFHATPRMYKSRVKVWGLKKYLKKEEKARLIRQVKQRGPALSLDLNGRPIIHRLQRHCKENGIIWSDRPKFTSLQGKKPPPSRWKQYNEPPPSVTLVGFRNSSMFSSSDLSLSPIILKGSLRAAEVIISNAIAYIGSFLHEKLRNKQHVTQSEQLGDQASQQLFNGLVTAWLAGRSGLVSEMGHYLNHALKDVESVLRQQPTSLLSVCFQIWSLRLDLPAKVRNMISTYIRQMALIVRGRNHPITVIIDQLCTLSAKWDVCAIFRIVVDAMCPLLEAEKAAYESAYVMEDYAESLINSGYLEAAERLLNECLEKCMTLKQSIRFYLRLSTVYSNQGNEKKAALISRQILGKLHEVEPGLPRDYHKAVLLHVNDDIDCCWVDVAIWSLIEQGRDEEIRQLNWQFGCRNQAWFHQDTQSLCDLRVQSSTLFGIMPAAGRDTLKIENWPVYNGELPEHYRWCLPPETRPRDNLLDENAYGFLDQSSSLNMGLSEQLLNQPLTIPVEGRRDLMIVDSGFPAQPSLMPALDDATHTLTFEDYPTSGLPHQPIKVPGDGDEDLLFVDSDTDFESSFKAAPEFPSAEQASGSLSFPFEEYPISGPSYQQPAKPNVGYEGLIPTFADPILESTFDHPSFTYEEYPACGSSFQQWSA